MPVGALGHCRFQDVDFKMNIFRRVQNQATKMTEFVWILKIVRRSSEEMTRKNRRFGNVDIYRGKSLPKTQ
jgi:hypothetical protein